MNVLIKFIVFLLIFEKRMFGNYIMKMSCNWLELVLRWSKNTNYSTRVKKNLNYKTRKKIVFLQQQIIMQQSWASANRVSRGTWTIWKMILLKRTYTDGTYQNYAGLKTIFESGFVPTLEHDAFNSWAQDEACTMQLFAEVKNKLSYSWNNNW